MVTPPKRLRVAPVIPEIPKIEEDAAQHLWAISYSDLLMVLLTFFIVYFQFDEAENIPKHLAKLVHQLGEKQLVAMANNPPSKTESAQRGVSKALLAELEKLPVELNKSTTDVTIHLSNDIFNSGQFKI